MTNKELLDKIRKEILHLKMKELQRTNGVNTGADVHLSSYAVLSILSNALTEESEDERIRKALVKQFGGCIKDDEFCHTGFTYAEITAWLEKQKEQNKCPEFCSGHCVGCEQKEQKPIDYPYLPGWRKNRDNNKPELKRSVLMLTTHGVAEGEWLGEKWCQYRWSCELKDGEVLYWIHLSDLERLEKEGEEKQKEQKPDWSEEDEKKMIFLERLIEHNVPDGQYGWADGRKGGFVTKSEAISILKSLRPSWKPSDQDELMKLKYAGTSTKLD